jgi:4-hydroxy-4-methyl-2-oxoglutarate aldolase
VEIGGLQVAPGDLVHGDCHGIHTIPLSIAEAQPEAVKNIVDREAELIKFCQSLEFSLEKLTTILNREIPACQPPDRR